MICMLAQGVSNLSTIYEESGNPITKHRGFLSMHFHEYNLTVEYYRVPFLVVVDRPPANALKEVRGVIRLDKLHWYFTKWVEADIIIFNAGHWWNEDKTVKMYEFKTSQTPKHFHFCHHPPSGQEISSLPDLRLWNN